MASLLGPDFGVPRIRRCCNTPIITTLPVTLSPSLPNLPTLPLLTLPTPPQFPLAHFHARTLPARLARGGKDMDSAVYSLSLR